MQVSWQKQSGPVTFLTNYTFSKVLGIWDYVTSNGAGSGPNVDSFNLKNNYGPLAYDHTQCAESGRTSGTCPNSSTATSLPGRSREWMAVLRIYGISELRAAATWIERKPERVGYPGDLSVPTVGNPTAPDYSILLPNGLRSISVNQATWFGTASQRVLLPQLTLQPEVQPGPRPVLQPRSCFAPPAYGSQGIPGVAVYAWPSLLRQRSGAFQELPNSRKPKAPVPYSGNQLPESPAEAVRPRRKRG